MPWNPGDDVIAVQRAPQPGGVGGVYRAFGETLRGLKTTFARIPDKHAPPATHGWGRTSRGSMRSSPT